MPLDLPNLDDLTWQQLATLGRGFIPGWAPEWTNHNPADPGITLVELFAYLSEILIYRVNRISAANMRAFLRLINGPEWTPPEDLERAKRGTLRDLRRIRRAVTAEDFEALAGKEAPDPWVKERVARAKAIFRRRLDSNDPASSAAEAPGFVSVIAVPKAETGFREPSEELLERVRQGLEPARLLTTRIHVVKPRYLSFSVHATLVVPTTVHPGEARRAAIEALTNFFDPLKGGLGKQGWPFGRSIYVSEVYEILGKLAGVRSVKRSIAAHTGRSLEELAVADSEAGRRRLNQDGKLEAIHVNPEELVHLELQEGNIKVVHEGQGYEAM